MVTKKNEKDKAPKREVSDEVLPVYVSNLKAKRIQNAPISYADS